jgi:TonB-linked SusC/RagA family outer membrane protein
MKLTIALILIFNLQLLAKGFSQSRVTLDLKSADFKRIVSQVEKKTSYRFVFSTKKIPTAIFKDIKVDNQEVSEFLDQLLNGTGYTYQLLNNNLIVIVSVGEFVKDIPITGKVVDETDQPLIGVTIRVKGAVTGGVATDINGTFHITAPENAVLIVSYVGYDTQNVPILGQNTLTIKLKSASKNLNEIVVIGYGTQKKTDVTGAVASISGDALREVPAQANISQSLQGRIAGLDISSTGNSPASGNQIRLRGERSFATNSSSADATNGPLFVLDGVPFINGSLNDINPDDISSIEVLKDASATAIYGSRASGGVILISTKRGKNGKTMVDFNTVTGVSNAVGHYNVMNAEQYLAFKQESIAGNSTSPGTTSYPITVAEQVGINNGTNTDWVKLLMRSGVVSDNQLRISGGNEKTQFALSGGYRKDKGIEYGQSFNRGSMLFSLDAKISKIFKVGITSNNVLDTRINNGDYTSTAFLLSPLLSPYNPDGTINVRPTTGSLDQLVRLNPLTLRDPNIQAVTRRIATNNVAYGEANIIDGLKFRLNASLSYNQSQGNNYNPVNTIVNTNTTQDQSSASISNNENYVYIIENLLAYDKTFGKHHIMFTGLFSTEKDHTQASGLNATGIPADYLQSYNLYLANSTSVGSGSFSYAERGLISYMARAFYGFNDKYLLTATVRRDGSSVLGPGHQYFTYPAFAFGWNVDRENFMKSVLWVNSLKLRAGYGVTADQNINPYQILGNLTAVAYNFGSSLQNGYLVSSIPNPDLKFEHTNNINIGVDFGILNNRINGTVDVYTQRTYDILQVQSLPLSAGASTTTVNAGNSKGKGLEISLNSRNLVGAFKWTTDFNIAFARSSITALRAGLQQDVGNGWFVGQPFNVIYDYKKTGIWQTNEASDAAKYSEKPGMIKVEDVNNDGKIDANDRQILGTYQPNYTAGLTNRFSYKGFDLTTVMFARMGQKVSVAYLDQAGGFFNIGRVNQVNVNYWTPTNPTNDFPRPNASLSPLYGSTVEYRDGSFIKMRSISLAYNFPTSILKNGPVRSLRVSALVNNPFIIYSPLVSNGLAFDPESNSYGGTGGRALTIGINLPQTRIWSIGINAGF